MAIDCHMHYEPRIFTLERMLACMDSHGIEKTALIPTMVEPFYLETRPKEVAGDLMRRALLSVNPFGQLLYQSTLSQKGYFVLLGKKYKIIDRPSNEDVAEVVSSHPDRFVGWIFINPGMGDDGTSEISRWSREPWMIGVKAHPFWHRYPVELLEPAAAWCSENGYPILIHLGAKGGSGDYRRLPEKFPDLKVLYAHAGIPYYRSLWEYIKGKKNVYIDLSSPYLNVKLVRSAVDFLGPDKCLYGTDGPYGAQCAGEDYDYGVTKGWVEALPLSDADREKILSRNFESIAKQ